MLRKYTFYKSDRISSALSVSQTQIVMLVNRVAVQTSRTLPTGFIFGALNHKRNYLVNDNKQFASGLCLVIDSVILTIYNIKFKYLCMLGQSSVTAYTAFTRKYWAYFQVLFVLESVEFTLPAFVFASSTRLWYSLRPLLLVCFRCLLKYYIYMCSSERPIWLTASCSASRGVGVFSIGMFSITLNGLQVVDRLQT